MRRLFVTILGIFCLAGAAHTAQAQMTKPVNTLEVTGIEQAATSVRVISQWALPGQPVDSIVVSTSLAGALVTHVKAGTATRDTANFPIVSYPPGTSVGGQVDVQSKRRGLLSSVVTTQFVFTRSDTPPPPITTLTVAADSI